ncbi:60S ribosomal protein L7-like [Trichogramma pretiosum]|uniref:60S ribosomal protein L7-like n=1 Tax=Trichogramma pretiosum TaxID=7493 RepID=UPI0006C95E4D|nr:60S ribosomal protein L7-like [Trichogramma pretiosum]
MLHVLATDLYTMADTQENKPKVPLTGKLPSVPESVLKRRKNRQASQAHRLQVTIKRKADQAKKRRQTLKTAEQFVKEHRLKQRDNLRIIRHTKKTGLTTEVPKNNESKIAFVIRIRSTNQVSPKVKKVFQLLRLKQTNTGIFLKLNEATRAMLDVVDPYITWGYPNLKSVRELVQKRGFANINKERVPITGNAMIEKELGDKNIICFEDLIHEIFTCGEKFNHATGFLRPFKLNNPNGGWRKKTLPFTKSGDYGNREDQINELIRRML